MPFTVHLKLLRYENAFSFKRPLLAREPDCAVRGFRTSNHLS